MKIEKIFFTQTLICHLEFKNEFANAQITFSYSDNLKKKILWKTDSSTKNYNAFVHFGKNYIFNILANLSPITSLFCSELKYSVNSLQKN